MIKFCQQNKDNVLIKMFNGPLDFVASSSTNFVDEIILSMHNNGILKCLENSIVDKRAENTTIPFDLILVIAIAAKMMVKTGFTDISFAILTIEYLLK